MDKEILIQYTYMKAEVKDLHRRIEKLTEEINNISEVTDYVSCGKKGRKSLGMRKVTGFPYPRYEQAKRILQERKNRLALSEEKLLELTGAVEKYIDEMDNSELRILFRLYYVDGLIWDMVAMKMNYMFPKRKIAYTKENCRKRHDRFLEKFEKNL